MPPENNNIGQQKAARFAIGRILPLFSPAGTEALPGVSCVNCSASSSTYDR